MWEPTYLRLSASLSTSSKTCRKARRNVRLQIRSDNLCRYQSHRYSGALRAIVSRSQHWHHSGEGKGRPTSRKLSSRWTWFLTSSEIIHCEHDVHAYARTIQSLGTRSDQEPQWQGCWKLELDNRVRSWNRTCIQRLCQHLQYVASTLEAIVNLMYWPVSHL